jgi:hypothetical protein
MPVYEVLLRYQDHEELRLTDKPLEVGSHVQIAGGNWLVESQEAKEGREVARYICVEVRERSVDLHAISSELLGRSNERRDGSNRHQAD